MTLGLAALHDGDAGVRGTEVDADDFGHEWGSGKWVWSWLWGRPRAVSTAGRGLVRGRRGRGDDDPRGPQQAAVQQPALLDDLEHRVGAAARPRAAWPSPHAAPDRRAGPAGSSCVSPALSNALNSSRSVASWPCGEGRGIGRRGGLLRQRERVGDRQEIRRRNARRRIAGPIRPRVRSACGRFRVRRWRAGNRRGAARPGPPPPPARDSGARRRRGIAPDSPEPRRAARCRFRSCAWGCGAQSREFKAEPSIRAAISTTGITRS